MNDEILFFCNWYRKVAYPQFKNGAQHPFLKLDQQRRIHDTLEEFCQSFYCDYHALQKMAVSFFERVERSDHNLNHFATPGLLEVRFYDVAYYGEPDL